MDKRMIFTLGLAGIAAAAALVRPHSAPVAAGFATAPHAAVMPPRSETSGGRDRSERAGARSARVVVYVAGEVVRPGVYALPAGARAEAAIRVAGGLRDGADAVAVNLARPLEDGEEVAVPAKGESANLAPETGPGPKRRSSRRHRRLRGAAGAHRRAHKAPEETVDVNSADAAALETLPGVGPALADRIVEFRDANGPFASLDDLLDVAGTSPRLIEEIQPYAVAGGR